MTVPNPAHLVTAPLGGLPAVKASRWAHAAWQNMADHLDDPSRFRIIQPCYNTGVPQSAGTHDFDAACDFYITGMTFAEASQFGRRWGIANWHRTPSQGDWSEHCHGFPIPPHGSMADGGRTYFILAGAERTRVGIFLPGQLVDYGNDALGLADEHTPGSDPQPHPKPQYVFNYKEYVVSEQNIINAIKQDGDRTRAVVNARALADRTRDKAILDAIDALPVGATKGDVRIVVEKALAAQAAPTEALTLKQCPSVRASDNHRCGLIVGHSGAHSYDNPTDPFTHSN